MALMGGTSGIGGLANSFALAWAKNQQDTVDAAARGPLMSRAAPSVTAPTAPTTAAPIAAPADSEARGNALDQSTVDRAHQVYQGLVARGMDPTTAIGFAANAVQESRANPLTNPGDMGASHGLLQWRADRLAAYVAKYGHPPEKGSLGEQLDFVMHELGGSESLAAKNIAAAANDPASRAAAVSQHYERPKDTAAEIGRRGYIANQLASRFAQMGSA